MMSDNLPKNEQFLSTNRFLRRNHAEALNDRINFNFELYNGCAMVFFQSVIVSIDE